MHPVRALEVAQVLVHHLGAEGHVAEGGPAAAADGLLQGRDLLVLLEEDSHELELELFLLGEEELVSLVLVENAEEEVEGGEGLLHLLALHLGAEELDDLEDLVVVLLGVLELEVEDVVEGLHHDVVLVGVELPNSVLPHELF